LAKVSVSLVGAVVAAPMVRKGATAAGTGSACAHSDDQPHSTNSTAASKLAATVFSRCLRAAIVFRWIGLATSERA